MLDIDTKIEKLLEQQQRLQHKLEEQKQQNRSEVKLPELKIPTFDGDKLKWTEFWDFFQVTVDQNNHLSNMEKFIYLKNSLTGDAKQAVAGILMSNNNYQNAKTLLMERFKDAEVVKHTHFLELINLRPAVNNPKDLRAVYDNLEIHLRSLESLHQDTNHDIFVSIIASKIPRDVLLQLALQKGAKEKWVASTLRKSFNNYICATEWAEQMSCLEKPKEYTQTHTNGFYRRFILQCIFCNGNQWSDQCVEYPMAEDRKHKIKDSCFLCLKAGHIAHECRLNKACCYCKRINHYHRSLCPQRFGVKQVNEATMPIKKDNQMGELNKNEKGGTEHVCQDIKQEQKGMPDITNKEFRNVPTSFNNKNGLTNELILEQSVKVNTYNNIVSEGTCGRNQADNEGVFNKLITENAELHAKNAELIDRLLGMAKEISVVQHENEDLEAELRDISDSLRNKHKLPEEPMQSGDISSTCNLVLCQNLTNTNKEDENELMKEDIEQTSLKLQETAELHTYIENSLNCKADKSTGRFSVYLRGNIHQHRHMDRFLWPWECRGNPTILL